MRPRIADNWVPPIYSEMIALSAGTGWAEAAWPTANKAIYVPIIFPFPCQLYNLRFPAGNGTGNFDLGFYDGYTKAKIQATGSTAMTAAGVKTLSFSPEYRVDAGKLYYAALALSSTSGQAARNSAAGIPALIGAGVAQELSAVPLPATMTPVTISSAYIPLMIFGVR